jgi:hypothetical protein
VTFLQLEPGGVVTLNYMWLPTWLGLNVEFKRKLEQEFSKRVKGVDSDQLQRLEVELLDYIVEQFPGLPGLRDYLDGIKFVQA